MHTLSEKLKKIGILPVVTAYSVDSTVTLAKTLAENGIPCIEITCRTPCAIDAIKAVKEADLGILLGVGTVTDSMLLEKVSDIGVDFAVSPGVTTSLLQATSHIELPLLPGVSSGSDIMLCMEYGLKHMKIFPAVPINAIQLLKAFFPPFPEVQFCPTGGINMANLQAFMGLPNVFCVGGSWMVPKKLIDDGEWDSIAKLCKECRAVLDSFI